LRSHAAASALLTPAVAAAAVFDPKRHHICGVHAYSLSYGLDHWRLDLWDAHAVVREDTWAADPQSVPESPPPPFRSRHRFAGRSRS